MAEAAIRRPWRRFWGRPCKGGVETTTPSGAPAHGSAATTSRTRVGLPVHNIDVMIPPVEVVLYPDAEVELAAVPVAERAALLTALQRLALAGVALGYPHTSQVRGATALRELRPRGGRSPWRAFYRRIGAFLVVGAVGAVGPEAQADPQGFARACGRAVARLDGVVLVAS